MSSPCICIERRIVALLAPLRRVLPVLLLLAAAPSGWAQSIEKLVMPGEVISGHAKYESECERCHKPFDKAAQNALCMDCHKEVGSDVANKVGAHGRLADPTCRTCHTDHKGRAVDIAPINEKTFDHAKTDFRLNGAHADPAKAKCDSCHRPKTKYREAPRLCNDCHQQIDNDKGHQGALGPKCESCHSEKNWTETTFDHEKTKFKLKTGGKHFEVKCADCHTDGKRFQKTPLTCNGCHQKIDREKGHQGKFGIKCESCHNDKSWKEITFNHDRDTKYQLKGKHRPPTKCTVCHTPATGTIYTEKLPTKCVSCHKKDDRDKGHQGKLGDKCESCHSERDWKDSLFDHDKTEFKLRDKHKDAKCEACHKGGVAGVKGKPRAAKVKAEMDCVACHKKDDDDKGHQGRYGAKCETCHGAKDWKLVGFNHDHDTKYPLKGKHRPPVKCDACHLPALGEIYKNKLDEACYSCHRKDDKHKGQLGKKCDSCHEEKKWEGVPYDHNKSRYPLTGSHAKVECKKCHATVAYRDTPLTCNGCHEKDDKHKGRFGGKCETCHYVGTWKSWDFDHATTKYALDGAHLKVSCDACHSPVHHDPLRPGRTCVACHLAEDVHDGGFSMQCERCHFTSDWKKVRR